MVLVPLHLTVPFLLSPTSVEEGSSRVEMNPPAILYKMLGTAQSALCMSCRRYDSNMSQMIQTSPTHAYEAKHLLDGDLSICAQGDVELQDLCWTQP